MEKVKFFYLRDVHGNYLNSISFFNKPMMLRPTSKEKEAIMYTEENCNRFRVHYLQNEILCFPVEAPVKFN